MFELTPTAETISIEYDAGVNASIIYTASSIDFLFVKVHVFSWRMFVENEKSIDDYVVITLHLDWHVLPINGFLWDKLFKYD